MAGQPFRPCGHGSCQRSLGSLHNSLHTLTNQQIITYPIGKNLGFPLPHVEQSPNISRILRKEVKDPHDFGGDFLPLSSWREGHLDPANLTIHIADKNENHNRICCIQTTRNINISKIYHSFTSCCCHFQPLSSEP